MCILEHFLLLKGFLANLVLLLVPCFVLTTQLPLILEAMLLTRCPSTVKDDPGMDFSFLEINDYEYTGIVAFTTVCRMKCKKC